MIPGITAPLGGLAGAALPSLTYVGDSADNTAKTVYTFSAEGTGTPGNRKTIVGVVGGDTATDFSISSVTVGGVAATEVIDSANASSVVQSGIYIIDNPSGTSADIVVTFSESITRCLICVWAAYDLVSSTPTDTATDFDTAGASLTLSLDVAANGVAVGVFGEDDDSSLVSWTGLTERSEISSGASLSAADTTSAAGATPLAVTADSDTTNHVIGVSASFR